MQSGVSFMQSGLILLNELSRTDLQWLLASGRIEQLSPGRLLVSQGSRVESLYLVLSGLLRVFIGSPADKELASLGPGQIVGEMSFLENRPASANVTALEPSCVLTLSRQVLDEKLAADPAFSTRLYRALAIAGSRRLRDLIGTISRWMEDQGPAGLVLDGASLELAERTQQLKTRIREVQKQASESDSATLSGEFRQFITLLNETIGDSADRSIDLKEDLGARVQRELLPYLLQSTLARRLYTKPRGYSEDFETLAHVYGNHASGSDPLGEQLDRCLLDLPVIAALRNRQTMIVERLIASGRAQTGKLRIACIGSGTGEEAFAALTELGPDRLEATLIEFDCQAFEQLSQRTRSLADGTAMMVREQHLLALITGEIGAGLGDLDLVWLPSIGNYFADRALLALLNGVHTILRPGGQVVVGFLNRSNPDKAFMDYVLDWRAAHRSELQMESLLAASTFGRLEASESDLSGIVTIASARRSDQRNYVQGERRTCTVGT